MADFVQYAGMNGYLADALQRGVALSQQRRQQNAQAFADTANIVGQNLQKQRMSQLLQGSFNSDGSINQQAYLQGLSQIDPNGVVDQSLKIGKNNSEVAKNLAAAKKDNQSALETQHKMQQGKLTDMTNNIGNIMTMIKQSKSDEDKNRAIQYAESAGVPIPAYYKNTPWSPQMVQQATTDLLAAKDEVSATQKSQQLGFDMYKQQYNEGQDQITNARQNEQLGIQQGNLQERKNQNQSNNFNRDNGAINKYQTVIDTANNEYRANVGKAQVIMNKSKDLYNKISNIQAQSGSAGGSFQAAIQAKIIPQGTWSTLQADLNSLKGLMFLNGTQQMKGLGALSDADAARLVQSYGTFETTMSFDYLKGILMDAYQSAQRGLMSGAQKLSEIRKTNMSTINNIKSGWQNDPQYANAAGAMGSQQLTQAQPVNAIPDDSGAVMDTQAPASNFSAGNALQSMSTQLPYSNSY